MAGSSAGWRRGLVIPGPESGERVGLVRAEGFEAGIANQDNSCSCPRTYGLAHGLPTIWDIFSPPPSEFDKLPLLGYALNCTFPNKNAFGGGYGTDRGPVSTPAREDLR